MQFYNLGHFVLNRSKRFSIGKFVALKHRLLRHQARMFTARETPELIKAYDEFGRATQSGARRQPFKGWDLWMLLEQYKPRAIVELGSGTTSAVFALWALRHGANYVCYEHHPEWAKVTEDCLREAGLIQGESSPIRTVSSRIREDRNATGFVEGLPSDSDFVYVDGPPCRIDDGRKVPNDDVVRLFDRGVAPRTIVVDGRLDTVDLIRSHREGANYSFEPSFVYALRRGLWSEALVGREHTVLHRN